MALRDFLGFKKKNEFTVDLKSFLPDSYATLLKVHTTIDAIAILKETLIVDIDAQKQKPGWLRVMFQHTENQRAELLKKEQNSNEALLKYHAEMKKSAKETLEFLQRVFDHLEKLYQKNKVDFVTLAKKTCTEAKEMDKMIQVPTVAENASSHEIYAQCGVFEEHHVTRAISDGNRKAMQHINNNLTEPLDDFMGFASQIRGIHYGLERIEKVAETGELNLEASKSIPLKRPI